MAGHWRDIYDHERDDHGRYNDRWAAGWHSPDEPVKRSKPFNHRLPDLAPELWDAFKHYLSHRGLSPSTAKANHWYPTKDSNSDYGRIVMPATSRQEGNHFYQTRAMSDEIGVKRYDSPHGCSSGDAVIVVYPDPLPTRGVSPHLESVVVEGPMCALAAAMTGRLGIALMGADPPKERIDLTSELIRATICYVVIDTDRPIALVKVMANLANRGNQCRLRDPSPAKDLAEMSPGNRALLF